MVIHNVRGMTDKNKGTKQRENNKGIVLRNAELKETRQSGNVVRNG